MIDNPSADRGAFVKGPELQDVYTSEAWAAAARLHGQACTTAPLTDQQALPEFGAAREPALRRVAHDGRRGRPERQHAGAFGQTVNGNYGFATSKLNQYKPGLTKNPAPAHDLALYAPLHCPATPVADRDSDCAAGSNYDYPDQDLAASDYIVSVDIPNDPVDGKPMYKVTTRGRRQHLRR